MQNQSKKILALLGPTNTGKTHIAIDRMLELGAIKEVKKFNQIKIKKLNSVNHVIGIKEISAYLNKEIDLGDVKERILIKTRQYAKRQNTWSRGHMKEWKKLLPSDFDKF